MDLICIVCEREIVQKENNYVIIHKTNEIAGMCDTCIRKQIIGWMVSLSLPQTKRNAIEQRKKMAEDLPLLKGDTLYDEK